MISRYEEKHDLFGTKDSIYDINYTDDEGRQIEAVIGFENNEIIISSVKIDDYWKGLGLCRALTMFLIIKAYNHAVEKGYKDKIMNGYVFIESENKDNAFNCYKNSYQSFGFTTKNKTEDILFGIETVKLYFQKERPKDGWEKLTGIYKYKANRFDIDYVITRTGIYAI